MTELSRRLLQVTGVALDRSEGVVGVRPLKPPPREFATECAMGQVQLNSCRKTLRITCFDLSAITDFRAVFSLTTKLWAKLLSKEPLTDLSAYAARSNSLVVLSPYLTYDLTTDHLSRPIQAQDCRLRLTPVVAEVKCGRRGCYYYYY